MYIERHEWIRYSHEIMMVYLSGPDELLPIILNQFNSILFYSHSGSALERLAEDQAQQIFEINGRFDRMMVQLMTNKLLEHRSSAHKAVLKFCIKSLADNMSNEYLTHWLG